MDDGADVVISKVETQNGFKVLCLIKHFCLVEFLLESETIDLILGWEIGQNTCQSTPQTY